MFATKTAKTAPAATEVTNTATALPDVAAIAATFLAAATPAAAPKPKKAKARHACRCADFVASDDAATDCGGAVTTRVFAPGHDAKLKGLLIRAAIAGELVADAKSGRTEPATVVADLFGFADLVAAGVAKAEAKAKPKPAPVASATEPTAPSADEAALAASEEELPREELAEIVKAEEDLFAALLAEARADAEADFAAAEPDAS